MIKRTNKKKKIEKEREQPLSDRPYFRTYPREPCTPRHIGHRSGVERLIELPPFRNRLPSTPGVAMAIAGGPEARLADPHAREKPGHPLPRVASSWMSQTLHPRRNDPLSPSLSPSFSLSSLFLLTPTCTWIYTQFNSHPSRW